MSVQKISAQPLSYSPGVAQPVGLSSASPGYKFFSSQFFGSSAEVRRVAMRLGLAADRSGRLDDVKKFYKFLFRKLSGTGNEVKFAAARAAVVFVTHGRAEVSEFEEAYDFYSRKFFGSSNDTKFAAARFAARAAWVGDRRFYDMKELYRFFSGKFTGSGNEVELATAYFSSIAVMRDLSVDEVKETYEQVKREFPGTSNEVKFEAAGFAVQDDRYGYDRYGYYHPGDCYDHPIRFRGSDRYRSGHHARRSGHLLGYAPEPPTRGFI